MDSDDREKQINKLNEKVALLSEQLSLREADVDKLKRT